MFYRFHKKPIILYITAFILILISSFWGYTEWKVSHNPQLILQAEVVNSDSSNKRYINIYDSGKTRTVKKFLAKNCQTVRVDPWIFKQHVTADSKVYLTVNKFTLKDENNNVIKDKNFYKLVKLIAKDSDYDIGILNLFKVHDKYYAFKKYNAGLSDEGTLYEFNQSNKKLIKTCSIDSGEIINLKHVA